MSAAMFPSCDRCVAQAAPAGLVTVLASSLAFIEGCVVNVGLPSSAT